MSVLSLNTVPGAVLQYDRPQPWEITAAHLRTGRVFFALAGAVALDLTRAVPDIVRELQIVALHGTESWSAINYLRDFLALPFAYVVAALLTGLYIRRGSHVAGTAAKWLALALGLYGLLNLAPIIMHLCFANDEYGPARELCMLVGWISVFADVSLILFAAIAIRHSCQIGPAREAIVGNPSRFQARLASTYHLALAGYMVWLIVDTFLGLRSFHTLRAADVGVLGFLQPMYQGIAGGVSTAWLAAALAFCPALRAGTRSCLWLALLLLAWPLFVAAMVGWRSATDICTLAVRPLPVLSYSFWCDVWWGDGFYLSCALLPLLLTALCANSLIRALLTPGGAADPRI